MVHSDRENHGWSGRPVRRSVGSSITVFSGRARFRALTALVAGCLLAVGGGVAHADDIYNNIDTSIDAVAEVMPLNVGGSTGTTTLYVDPTGETKDPADLKSGCNLTGSTTLVLNLASSNTSVATVSPSSVTFTSCGFKQVLTVTPVAVGSATITASQTSNNTGGTFNLAPVTFTVNVTAAAPANTAPVVTVAGVAGGATYNKGSVPAASCNVIDAEDGNSSFAATLSAVTGTYASDGIGSQTASCSYTDGGGINASSSGTYSIIDPSAPVIGYTLTPNTPGGLNGWYIGNVSLVWSVSDLQSPNSLVTVGCVDQSIISDQNATAYTCDASSAGGSATQVSVTIKRDATAPTFTATPSAAANGAGYNNGAVDVAYICSDATSGLAVACPDTDHATADGTHVFAHTISDQAGNSSSVSTTVKLDATKPTITGTRTLANGDGWNNTDVTVTFTCTDIGTGASGIKSCVADGTSPALNEKTLSGEGANQSVSGTATDNADNTNTATVDGINIDKTDPVITFASRTPANLAGWNNGNVTVTWTCTDVGGSGVVASPVSQIVTTEGSAQSATGTCTDLAGNTASDTHGGIKIDLTAPGIAFASATPAANGAGWNNTAVTVTWNCTDLGGSGVVDPTVSQILNTEGADLSASGTCADLAGNTSAINTHGGIKIDLTNPTDVAFVGGPAAGASYYFGSVPAAPTCTAADAVSGLASCQVSGYSASVGSHTLTATATDNADRTATATRSYTVLAWTLNGFYQPVDMNGMWNTVKGGSTVPLKFEIFSGTTELTNTSAVQSFTVKGVLCPLALVATDDIELLSTGGTILRYDSTGGQFIQNWQTPKKPGVCYSTTMTTIDGSYITALFKLK